MVRRIAVVCVLATQAFGAQIASAATKQDTRKHGSKGSCVGADSPPVDEATRRQASRVVLCLVNRERRARQLPPLRRSRPLAKAARRHSADMVGRKYFSHFSSGGDVRRRAIRSGYVRRSRRALLGETLAWGAGSTASPQGLVALFMSSSPHRRTLLSRRYRDLGVGLALGAPASDVDGSATTLTIAFGRR